jgi:HK97 gp10 family phage protein
VKSLGKTVSLDFDLGGFNSAVDNLADKVQATARPAAQAGAQVLYDAVKLNVRRLGRETGNLERAIYQVYSVNNSSKGVAQYQISYNARKAPHGHLVEFGYYRKYTVVLSKRTGKWITIKSKPLPQPVQVAAKPFIRPAKALMPQAVNAVRAELKRQLKELP